MSTDEIVGLILTTALFSGVGGVVLTAMIAAGRDRMAGIRARRMDAYARWLAARWTLTRASISFVAAFRALAAENRKSDYFGLRRHEAQRARSAWCDAIQELDCAEAALVTWSADPSIREHLAQFQAVPPDTLREAINSTQEDVDRLSQRLREADGHAAEFVRAATADTRARGSPHRAWFTRVGSYIESIVDHWGQR